MRPPTGSFSLATFVDITTRLGTHYAEQIDTTRRNLEHTKSDLAESMDTLERRTNHFIQYGWADLRVYSSMPIRPFNGSYGRKHWSWEKYFRALAHDMRRPFIYARTYYAPVSTAGVLLSIPKRKYLNVLSASFFLLDQARQTHNTVEWQWWLEPGMFERWCDMLRTDPAMQEALWRQRT